MGIIHIKKVVEQNIESSRNCGWSESLVCCRSMETDQDLPVLRSLLQEIELSELVGVFGYLVADSNSVQEYVVNTLLQNVVLQYKYSIERRSCSCRPLTLRP
jgi:hypothetical protein